MGEIEILGLSALLNWAEKRIFFRSGQISYWSGKIFSAQVKNGRDYQSGMTQNKAEWLYLIVVLLKQKSLILALFNTNNLLSIYCKVWWFKSMVFSVRILQWVENQPI